MTDQRQDQASPPVRVLIADDHAVVRRGLHLVVDTEPGMEVVGEAADGIEAVEKARHLQPDVILLDMVMPRQDGLAVIEQVKREFPDIHILVLTSFSEDDKLFPAIKAGALGYLLKDSTPDELLQAIRDVSLGLPALHPSITHRLMDEVNQPEETEPQADPLTKREMEVLELVAQGLSNQEIAEQLVISEWTVRTHVRNILGKLDLPNRIQAVLYALRKGLVQLE